MLTADDKYVEKHKRGEEEVRLQKATFSRSVIKEEEERGDKFEE